MSAGKEKKEQDQVLEGTVVLRIFGEGSKSEHEAICLQTDKDVFLLRRIGGNAFRDPVLLKLEGKNVKAKGMLNQNVFLAREVKEIKN